MKKNVAIITNAHADSGVGGRAYEIFSRMPITNDFALHKIFIDGSKNTLIRDSKEVVTVPRWPSLLGSKSISWIRLAKKLPQFDGYDLSNQSLSFIARKRTSTLLTVHDIIERTNPQTVTATILNRYLMSGIPHARHIVAVSEFVKSTIVEIYNINPSNITVIYNGVNEYFSPIPNFSSTIGYQTLIKELQLSEKGPFILFVGSEHPRKNIKTVLQVIKQLKKQYPDIVLLKVGDPGLLEGRRETLRLIDEYALQNHVKLLGKVASEQLQDIYRLADILLMPSHFEGFGMPIIEAMASGCPVVCSNAAALPEIAGDAALLSDPDDISALSRHIINILSDKIVRTTLQKKGLERAKAFSWDTAAKQTYDLYRKFL